MKPTKTNQREWEEETQFLIRKYLYIDPLNLDHWKMIAEKFGENCTICGKPMIPNKYADEFEKKLLKLIHTQIQKSVNEEREIFITEIRRIIPTIPLTKGLADGMKIRADLREIIRLQEEK